MLYVHIINKLSILYIIRHCYIRMLLTNFTIIRNINYTTAMKYYKICIYTKIEI